MPGVGFTRDEVILALDVFYSAADGKTSAKSAEMNELSELLNRLPIHPENKKKGVFRSATGIAQQLGLFKRSMKSGEKHQDVGRQFFDVAFEFEGRLDELHETAAAIRRNEMYYDEPFGSVNDDSCFPEGLLLGHLHRVVEARSAQNFFVGDRCSICNLDPRLYYQPCGDLLQLHLVVPPTKLDGGKKYTEENFITVCPTCHAVLHRYRPWRTKENCGEILR